MELFKNRAAAGSFLGSVMGGLLGGWVGAGTAFAIVTSILPASQTTQAIHAVAATHGSAAFVVWVYWIATGAVFVGIIGALVGSMIGASCAARRLTLATSPTPTAIAPPATPQDEEIARLKQRIAELERGRDERRES